MNTEMFLCLLIGYLLQHTWGLGKLRRRVRELEQENWRTDFLAREQCK